MPRTLLLIKNNITDQAITEALAQSSWVIFDATVSQSFSDRAQITEHPIENGSKITDHINILPRNIALTGVVSDEAFLSTSFVSGLVGGAALLSFFNSSEFVDNTFTAVTAAGAAAQAAGTFGASGRSDKAYDTLRQAISRGQVIDVYTPVRVYENMAMDSLQVDRDASTGSALTFNIGLKELNIVNTKKLVTQPDNDTRRSRTKRGRKNTKATTGNAASKTLNSSDSFLANLIVGS